MKISYKVYLVILIALIFPINLASAVEEIKIVGNGVTHRDAVKDGLIIVIEQVLGKFLIYKSQINEIALNFDLSSKETIVSDGFIKSYAINSCRNSKRKVICSLNVEVENDDSIIAEYLIKHLKNKTVSLNITGSVNRNPVETSSINDAFAKQLINLGYYIVKPSFGHFYHLKGMLDVDEAMTQYSDSSFVYVRLSNMRLSLIDKNNNSVAVYTDQEIKQCAGSGNNVREAAMDIFSCIAIGIGNKIIPLIKSEE